jgi:hypothetical protein
MRTIELPLYKIKIELNNNRGGTISSELKEVCPYCNDHLCSFDCPDAMEGASDRDIDCQNDKIAELEDLKYYNDKVNIIESIILAHAVAGVDIESPAYLEGIETVIDKCLND